MHAQNYVYHLLLGLQCTRLPCHDVILLELRIARKCQIIVQYQYRLHTFMVVETGSSFHKKKHLLFLKCLYTKLIMNQYPPLAVLQLVEHLFIPNRWIKQLAVRRDPFAFLQTEYMQMKYYRENFGLVVSHTHLPIIIKSCYCC